MSWTNKIIVGLVVPLLLFILGAIVKKLVRGSGWQIKDFYFGSELALANVSSGMLQLMDLVKPVLSAPVIVAPATAPALDPSISGGAAFRVAVYITFSFAIFLWVMSMHQDWETDDTGQPKAACKKQIVWLGVVANGLGLIMLFAFLVWVRGL